MSRETFSYKSQRASLLLTITLAIHRNSAPPRPSVLHPAKHLVIGLLHAAQVVAEAILVEFLSCGFVPEAAGVGADFVTEQNLAVMASELELEIDQHHAALVQEFAQYAINLQRHRIDLLELGRGGPSKHDRVLAEDQRIVERVRFVVVLDDRMRERFAFFAA